jgi:ATP-dependent DNA helicase RecG
VSVGLLDAPLRTSGIARGPMAARLGRGLGLHTVRDLVFNFPRRYLDFSESKTLREVRERPPDGPVSATVEVADLRVEPGFRRRVQRTVARVRDDTGEAEAVWFGRRYIERRLAIGDTITLSGKVEIRGWVPRFQNPEFGPAGDTLNAGRIVPVYRLTAGITAPWLRARIREALDRSLDDQPEYLPAAVRVTAGTDGKPLVELRPAIEAMHFPEAFDDRDAAVRRLAFDELLALQLGMVARLRQRSGELGLPIIVSEDRFRDMVATVEAVIGEQVAARRARLAADVEADAAVALTADQLRALDDVRADLGSERPMMRLLQGEVGSGKTAVAAIALAMAAQEHQGALLAPTDLLARQHAQTLSRLLEPLGFEVTLLTGSLPAAQRRAALELLGAPAESIEGRKRGRIAVGTHALVQDAVSFEDLRLVVVDEQHRFGVAEREALAAKGTAPHVLLMTATPIPRTLGQIVHADLDVSDLRTPPWGRQSILTGIRRTDELLRRADGREGALPLIVKEVAKGHRAFVVVPLVEDDAEAGARSVEAGATLIADNWEAAAQIAGSASALPRIEIVHGQMKASERDQRMERFRSGEVPIVVGTTVLEVGVDVPEATVMMILDAERFGLAQLHQLRGRVGRGEAQSFCVLVSERYPRDPDHPADDEEATVAARLDALRTTTDGFALAELDLEQRSAGDLLGLTQSGMPPLRVASLNRPQDRDLSLRARAVAEQIVDGMGRIRPEYPDLEHELRSGWLAQVGAGAVLGDSAKSDDSAEPTDG